MSEFQKSLAKSVNALPKSIRFYGQMAEYIDTMKVVRKIQAARDNGSK